jgi:tetratricopeptide (TPR) repeat protein
VTLDPTSHQDAAGGRTPDVAGILSDAPLAHLLVHLTRRELTGTLVLRGPDGAGLRLFVRGGAPTKIASEPASALLGEMLVRGGALAEEDLDEAVFRARLLREPLGTHLIREGWVERPAVQVALRRQILERLAAAQSLPPESEYEFYADADLVREAHGEEEARCDPLAALLAAVRAWRDTERVDRSLAKLAGAPLLLHPDAAPQRFGLITAERHALEAIMLEHPTLEELQGLDLDPAAVRSTVYALAIARHLAVGEANEPPLAVGGSFAAPEATLANARPAPASSPPPPPAADAPVAPAASISNRPPPDFTPTPMARAERPSSPPPAASAATDARALTPPSPPAAGVRPALAGHTLIPPPVARSSSPTQPRPLATPPPSPVRVGSTPPPAHVAPPPSQPAAAAARFAAAERAFSSGDLRNARLEAEVASTLAPLPEYRALASLALALDASAIEQVIALQALDRFVREAGGSMRPLRYRALLLQRLGRNREARRDFEAVLASDPYDVVAGKAIAELSQEGPRRPRR